MRNELVLKSGYIEITNKCNLYCKHCYNDSKFQNSTFLSTSIIEKLYRIFFENNINQISISGGEPLLHPDIITILKYSTVYKIKTQLITNGILLDQFCDHINNNPNILVQLSIDGYGQIHDKIRGAGVFEIVNSNLGKLSNRVNLSIKSTINSYNISQIETIVKYAIKKGAQTVAFSPLCNQGRSFNNREIHITGAQLKKAVDTVAELSEIYKDYIEVKKININYSQCPFSLTGSIDVSPRIDPFGNVFLCSMFTNPWFIIGNLKCDDLIAILKSEKCNNLIEFMHAFRNVIDCKQCLLNDLCQKGCLAQYLNNMSHYQDDMCSVKKHDFCGFIKNNSVLL